MKAERLQRMEEYVTQRGFVPLDELCQTFDISKNTVRRDVAELVGGGYLEKVYGGVKPARQSVELLVSFGDRTVRNVPEKNSIARLAAQFVEDNDVIFLDSGTTTASMLKYLRDRKGLTILTNNLYVMIHCMELPQINVITFGGHLNPATAALAASYFTVEHLQRFNISKAFMAATGVAIDTGASNSSSGESAVKQSVVQRCENCFLLADASKFGHSALLTYAPLAAFAHVITDKPPADAFLSLFASHGIQLHVSARQEG